MGQDYRYWAFISYSHRDKAWGDWLHKTLETYRVPARLVGRAGRDGPLPKRLYPVFRDREELPSSADLSNNINDSLAASRHLVVICSPRAAVSRWVNEEIIAYKRLGRADRILALVVDGEPNASDHPDSGELECFPPALRHKVDADGKLLTERVEPIAADARTGKDGKASARLKLLAGLLGVPFDELRQREKQRQRRQRLQWGLAALLLLALIGGAWRWETQRRADEAAIAGYTEQGRQLLLDNQPLQASAYLGEAYRLGGRSPVLRFLLARSMLYVDSLRANLPEPGLWLTADLSRDGKRMVAAGGGEDADEWDLETGKRLLSLREPGRLQMFAKFSPDGRYIVVASKVTIIERTVILRVVDSFSGKLLSSHKFDSALIVGAMFSPDSRHLLTRNEGTDKVQIWDAVTGKLVTTLDGHGVRIDHAGYSPDGRRVITSNMNHTLTLWDADDGKMLAYLRGHAAGINDFEFSPDSRKLASASDDKSVKMWDLRTGRLLFTIAAQAGGDYESGHGDAVTVASFSSDGKRLITGSKDKTVRVWDAATGKNLARMADMPDEIRSLEVSEDGSLIAASTKENTTWVWDGHDYTQRAVLPGYGAFFTRDGHRLITSSAKENVAQVWDVQTLLAPVRSVTGADAAYDPTGSRLATMDADQAWVWDAHSGKQLLALHLPPADPSKDEKAYGTTNIFSPDGSRLLTLASFSLGSALWDTSNGKLVAQMRESGEDTNVGGFTPDGSRIFTCGSNKTAELWDGHDGRLLASFPMPDGCIDSLHFTPDGRRLAGTRDALDEKHEDRTYRAEIWDLDLHKRVLAPPETLYSYNHGLALSPDGRVLATADKAGVIRLRELATGEQLASWDTQSGGIESLVYSPDGHALATAHQNGTLKVWDARDGALLWQYKSGTIGMDASLYSPDGNFILARNSNRDNTLREASNGVVLADFTGDSTLTETMIFSPAGDQIASQAYDYPTRLLDLRLEQRPPEAVMALIRCRVPWRLEGGQVLPHAPDASACQKP